MVGKSSVSALQEYCAKNKKTPPTYDYIDEDDGGFACKITFMDYTAVAKGRSKRDAKHNAAAQIIKRLRMTDVGEMPQMSELDDSGGIPPTDMIVVLRDYCVQHDIPLPIIDIVQQAGTPDAPEFTAICIVATIRRYGVSEKKKDARQRAAFEMLRVIIDDVDMLEQHMQVATLQNKQQEVEAERYHKFKTYRELTESKTGDLPGILICERHNYFTKFYDELKKAAHAILYSTAYESEECQAYDVLEALKIKPKKSRVAANKASPVLWIELDCDFDVVFAGTEETIYKDIIEYFKMML